MDFTLSSLMSGFIFGVIGFWMVKEGRRNVNFQVLFIGLALIIYPYFVSKPVAEWGIGIALCALAYNVW